MPPLHYAIGDVHGRDDLLGAMHECIAADRRTRYKGRPATVVHIGDYIDRGEESVAVIDRLMAGIEGFETVCLTGNHEAMLLRCLESEDQLWWDHWIGNGGDVTLATLGIEIAFGETGRTPLWQALLRRALGERRIAWLRSLPLYHETPGYLFVHAGIVPDIPLEEQDAEDLIWIRGPFLSHEGEHGFRVIHGHTTSAEPVVLPNRIGIDTEAVSSGKLTAVVLDGSEEPRFLTVSGPPGD